MPKFSSSIAAFYLIFTGALTAQQAVDATAQSAVAPTPQHAVAPTQGFHRVICLVHLTGTGTVSDPKRPEYAPTPSVAAAPNAGIATSSAQTSSVGPLPSAVASRSGILAWSFQITDDGTMAIVQFVARDRTTLLPIFSDARPEIRVFEVGVATRAQIEAEMQKYKKDFNLDKMQVVVR